MTLIVATVEASKKTNLMIVKGHQIIEGAFYFLVKSKQETPILAHVLEKKHQRHFSLGEKKILPEEELYHLSKGGGALVGGKFKLLNNINYIKIAR